MQSNCVREPMTEVGMSLLLQRQSQSDPKDACGLTLVELMITLLLSSVMTLGLVELYVASADSYRFLTGQSRMYLSAKLALNMIGRAVRQAGYQGCVSTELLWEGQMATRPSIRLPYEFNLPVPVQGYEGWTGTATWVPALADPAGPGSSHVAASARGVPKGRGAAIRLHRIQQGTDLLTVRYLSQFHHRLAGSLKPDSTHLSVRVADGGLEFGSGYFAMLHDCDKVELFRVAAAADADRVRAGELIRLQRAGPQFFAFGKTRVGQTDPGAFDAGAWVSGIVTDTYFIAPGAGVNNRGRQPLSLWLKSGLRRPVEMIEGVEDLQLLYGVDMVSGDQVPDRYLTADQVSDWRSVRTLRISITVNSVDDLGTGMAPTHGCTRDLAVQQFQDCNGTGTDGLIRRTFSQTIRLRNPA